MAKAGRLLGAIVAAAAIAACGGGDDGDRVSTEDGGDGARRAVDVSIPPGAPCGVTGEVSGAVTASFVDQQMGATGPDDSNGFAFFQASDRDVMVVVRGPVGDRPASVTIRSDHGTWTTEDPSGLTLGEDGRTVELESLHMAGDGGDVTVELAASCR